MEGTSSAAVVGPKKRSSQEPTAKAKRIKRLLASPDFAEAVSEERAAAKMWEDHHDDLHREYMVMKDERPACQDEVVDNLQLQNDYLAQLLENKQLNKVIETKNSTIKTQFEVIEYKQMAINALKGILEPNKKARNPNRVTGGKRGRPRGSKSKAVSFGADTMPDRDLVPFGSRAEVAAALM
jgi:hypothetical protein